MHIFQHDTDIYDIFGRLTVSQLTLLNSECEEEKCGAIQPVNRFGGSLVFFSSNRTKYTEHLTPGFLCAISVSL